MAEAPPKGASDHLPGDVKVCEEDRGVGIAVLRCHVLRAVSSPDGIALRTESVLYELPVIERIGPGRRGQPGAFSQTMTLLT